MNFKTTAASILVLSLFAGPVVAQSSNGQTPDPAVDVAAPPVPDDVLALINDRRTAEEMSDDELKDRLRAARKAAKDESLTQDIREQLQAIVDADKAALDSRSEDKKKQESAEQPAAQPEQPAAEQPVEQKAEQPVEQPAAEQPAQQAEQPAAEPAQPAVPPEIGALLDDTRPVSEISSEELFARAREARKLSQDESLSKDVRKQLTEIARAARKELQVREEAKAKQPEEKPKEQAEQPSSQEQPAAEAPKVEDPAANVVQEQPVVEQPAAEQPAAEAPPAPAPDKQQVQQLDGNSGEPEAEAKAKAFLEDPVPADQLDDEKLRARLDAMRDLMELNALSAKTERAMRQKLRADREVLRDRLAKVKAEEEAKAAAAAAEAEKKKQEEAAAAGQKTDAEPAAEAKKPNILITPETPRRRVLADRRRSEELDDSELRLRIQVYLDFERDDSYDTFDVGQRRYWRDTVQRDRAILRDRMVEKRNIRRIELDEDAGDNVRNIRIDDSDFRDADEIEDDVFAAEVDDEEIERVIVAPPKKKVRKIARVEDIIDKPEVRNSLRRIEVDTIRFGFNEAFVREEEIENLDQIALVLERVLKKYPREVFLIEGHTDAVGSDAYNMKLSKARAEAVKKALSSFYLIPAKNLKTVGLGERYLKIPTADQEPENRRVSISRATPVVGELQE